VLVNLHVCSNGMDVTLSSGLLTFKVIGGVIDLFVFDGPNPNDGMCACMCVCVCICVCVCVCVCA